jgi:transmembrane sensor
MNTLSLTTDQVKQLLLKKFSGERLLADEQAALDQWTASSEDHEKLLHELMDDKQLARQLQVVQQIGEDKMRKRLEALFSSEEPAFSSAARVAHRVHFLRTNWFRYAAAIVILLSISGYLWSLRSPQAMLSHTDPAPFQNDLAPGGNKATLTLGDGSVITLNDSVHGILATQAGSTITIRPDGSIAYVASAAPLKEATAFNTMRTPRGGQYQLVLPDGTLVWLNAASSITYPTTFIGKERRVTITGEAYLEVAQNHRQPFFVQVGHTEIAVLGTQFNINSYEDENGIRTTLLQGSVRIGAASVQRAEADDRSGVILKPGEQAVYPQTGEDGSDQIRVVHDADIEKVMAWKNGAFNFQNKGLHEVMRELARWYDLDVQYEKGVPDVKFGGEMSRNVPLSDVLKGLQNMEIHFKIGTGRKLLVRP